MFPYNVVSVACDAMELHHVAEGDVFIRIVKEVAHNHPDKQAQEVVLESMLRWFNGGEMPLSTNNKRAKRAIECFHRYMNNPVSVEADKKVIDPESIADFVISKC